MATGVRRSRCPAAVAAFVDTRSFRECDRIKESVLATYRDDFAKYRNRIHLEWLHTVFEKAPRVVGRKFKYVHIDPGILSRDLAKAVQMLAQARLLSLVKRTAANGIPLGAEVDDRYFKILLLDVGLQMRMLGLDIQDLDRVDDLTLVNAGSVCEQFVGQELQAAGEFWEEPALFCWSREKHNAAA